METVVAAACLVLNITPIRPMLSETGKIIRTIDEILDNDNMADFTFISERF